MSTDNLHNIIEASVWYNKQIGSQFLPTTNVPHSFTAIRGTLGVSPSLSILAALSQPVTITLMQLPIEETSPLQSAKTSPIHSLLLLICAPSSVTPMVGQLPLITNPFKILSAPSSVEFTIFCFKSCYSHNMLAKLAVILTLPNLPTTQYVRLNTSSFNSLMQARQPPWPQMIYTSNTSVSPTPCLMTPTNGMLHYHQCSLMPLPPSFEHTYVRVLTCILNQSLTP